MHVDSFLAYVPRTQVNFPDDDAWALGRSTSAPAELPPLPPGAAAAAAAAASGAAAATGHALVATAAAPHAEPKQEPKPKGRPRKKTVHPNVSHGGSFNKGSSKFRGVSWNSHCSKWRAQVGLPCRMHALNGLTQSIYTFFEDAWLLLLGSSCLTSHGVVLTMHRGKSETNK